MADTITPILLKNYLKNNQNTKVICYVNTSAAVKALCDVCVTSSNAEKVIDKFIEENGKDTNYLYVPDKNLAYYLNKFLKVKLKLTLKKFSREIELKQLKK